jgi:two-component system response regulator PilR (NtrC family)
MKRLRRDIGRVAQSAVGRVLVTGENGTGKETVAQQLHVQSKRQGPFLAFNCAAASRELLESRLFGYCKGAFTGATTDHQGLFQEADDGTLFLDEIAELPLETQGMLLRVLQEGRVQRIGEAEERRVDVRVVAATNRDLPTLVREGRFREDLYFRLSLIELHVPALRERPEDLAPIAQDLWRAMAPNRKPLSDADLAALASFDWPGNVRELGNVLERASIFRERTISELVEEERRRSGRAGEREMERPDGTGRAKLAFGEDAPLEDVVRAHVRGVWERHGRNGSEAARILGITRNTLRAKLGPERG